MTSPKKHHLDRRVGAIVSDTLHPTEELLSTIELAHWLGCSVQWLEIGRCKNYGPTFVRVNGKRVIYRKSDVLKWLDARAHKSTSEYVGADDKRKLNARKDRKPRVEAA